MMKVMAMKVMTRMTSSMRIQMQKSSRVPSLGALLVSYSSSHQAALQAVSCLLTEKLENGSFMSFPYQTTQGRNIPSKPTRIQIWANNPTNEKKWLILLPSQQVYLTRSSLLCLSETHKSFLHACTPERRTRALVHLFNQRTNVGGQRTQNISFKKNVGYWKRWKMIRAVEQVNPTAQNTWRLHACFVLFLA